MADAGPPAAAETTQQIRGSTMLFAGRILGLLIGLGTQVLLVRGLSRSSYGAFAFALALATSSRTIVSFGEDQAFTRFITLYEQRKDYARLLGTYVMVFVKVIAISALLIAGVILGRSALSGTLIDDPRAVDLLTILVFLAPIDAIDRMLEGSFAVFSKPRAIFFRKYVLEPGLRFFAVLLLVTLDRGPVFVAVGYVVAAALGMVVYLTALRATFRERGLLARSDRGGLSFPIREYFGFSVPLLTTELVNLSMNFVTILLLGRYSGAGDVAGFRAVFPVARLNQLVIFTFTMLFTPLAARLFARDDRSGMREAYWHTSAWLAVFTFPIAVVTITAADSVAITLFGGRYADAGVYLALLSAGYYLNAALGFNALTLQAWGQLRWVVAVNVVSAVVNVTTALVLIPDHGAAGAAASVAITLAAQNLLNQAGLRRLSIPRLDRRYFGVYGVVFVAGAAVAAFEQVLTPPLLLTVGLVGVASLVVIRLTRSRLDVGGTFPELAALPVLRKVLA